MCRVVGVEHPLTARFFYEVFNVEIRDLDIDGFADRLFAEKPQGDLEYALMMAMRDIYYRYSRSFIKKEIYQHGWCILRTEERPTVDAFKSRLRRYVRRSELFLHAKRVSISLFGDIEDEETQDIIVRDIINVIKKEDELCGEVFGLYLDGLSEREIASRYNFTDHKIIHRLKEKGIQYAYALCH